MRERERESGKQRTRKGTEWKIQGTQKAENGKGNVKSEKGGRGKL